MREREEREVRMGKRERDIYIERGKREKENTSIREIKGDNFCMGECDLLCFVI